MRRKKQMNSNEVSCCNYALSAGLVVITAVMSQSIHNDLFALITYAWIGLGFIFIMFLLSDANSGCASMIQCNHSPIYDDNSVMGLLGITESDLKSLRDNGLLGYSRHGDKYWYTQADIDRFLARCHYAPFADKQ